MLNRLLSTASVCALIAAALAFAPAPARAANDEIKSYYKEQHRDALQRRTLNQREKRSRRQRRTRKVAPANLPPSGAANAGKHRQAQLVYRQLRLERGMSHSAAVDAVRIAGYPTSRIKAIRR